MSQSQQIKEITERLQKGIEDLFDSENYKNYLKTMSRFTSYSLNNTLLIAMQKPDATAVAGYTTWKQLHRQVKKGEKAIKIIAPCPYKKKMETKVLDERGRNILDKNGKPLTEKEEKVVMGFRVVNVFDISSTEGEPLPEIVHQLDGTIEGYSDFMKALEKFSPVPIELKKVKGSALGYYQMKNKNIVIEKNLSEIMKCSTGIHEVTHAILHDKNNGLEKSSLPSRGIKEIEAESVSYVVCQYYGIDSSDYSFGYIAGWASDKNLEELKASMETIRQASQIIITGIDRELDSIKQEKHIQMFNADTLLKNNMNSFPTNEMTIIKSRKMKL